MRARMNDHAYDAGATGAEGRQRTQILEKESGGPQSPPPPPRHDSYFGKRKSPRREKLRRRPPEVLRTFPLPVPDTTGRKLRPDLVFTVCGFESVINQFGSVSASGL